MKQIGPEKNLCHVIIKTINAQNKERILKAVREKGQAMQNERPIRITLDFSTEALKTKKEHRKSRSHRP